MSKIKITIGFLVLAITIACGTPSKNDETAKETAISIKVMDVDQLGIEIEKREEALNKDSLSANKQTAARLMEAYATYAERFPNYNNAADYLFKAGELAMGLGHTVQSLKYFDKVYNDFSHYEKRPYALFMKAFVLENQAGEFERAKEVYEEFINEFPNHDMTEDAKYSIANIGKSPEELIREFERRDSIENAKKTS